MYFRDETTIEVAGGKGGDGVISFHREKYRPRGGPDGGDGGHGGSVVFIADENLTTLYELHRRRRVYAPAGKNGRSNNRSGKKGRDVTVYVPVGTIIRDGDTGSVLRDLRQHGEQVIVARGGLGGRGNQHFATAELQTPRIAEDGTPGEHRKLQLELRLIADIGLVGLPNAGKSTFLSVVSRAHPKIANYPFTTLVPQLGIASLDLTRTLVIADLPGLIEGASEGHGLGDQFLRHVERTRLLLHIVDCTAEIDELVQNVKLIDRELKAFSRSLAQKPQILVGNKLDTGEEARAAFDELQERLALDADAPRFVAAYGISAAAGEGVHDLLTEAWNRVLELKRQQAWEEQGAPPAVVEEELAPRDRRDRRRRDADEPVRDRVSNETYLPDETGITRQKMRLRGMQKVPPHQRFPDEMFRKDSFDTDATRSDSDPADDTGDPATGND